MPKGSLLLLLHAHLPYVRHPEHEYFLEENWFYEAVIETYLPLLDMLERLAEDHVKFSLTLSLSPTLLEMMNDPLLQARLLRHGRMLRDLAEREVRRNRKDNLFGPLARMYSERIKKTLRLLEASYLRNIPETLSRLERFGQIELITTSATHAYLPALAPFPETVRNQIRVGLMNHERVFGRAPEGMWLPECGYYEGIDQILSEEGVRYFFLESHGILHATPRATYGVFRPVRCPSGAVAFGRDSETALRVWSRTSGYPGNPDYRDFYRDIGFDLPPDDIRPFIGPFGRRIFTGIKYHSITGKTSAKLPYVMENAMQRAHEHAVDFINGLEQRVSTMVDTYGFSPLIVLPFDAELFGHWWFEGLDWLELLLRKLAYNTTIKTVTPSGYLAGHRQLKSVSPSASSWGTGGYGSTWMNETSAGWIHRLHNAYERLALLDPITASLSGNRKRLLAQAHRELLLASASDWGFLIHRGSHSSYAEKRLNEHLENFEEIYAMVVKGEVDMKRLVEIENMNNIFTDLGRWLTSGASHTRTSGRMKGIRPQRTR